MDAAMPAAAALGSLAALAVSSANGPAIPAGPWCCVPARLEERPGRLALPGPAGLAPNGLAGACLTRLAWLARREADAPIGSAPKSHAPLAAERKDPHDSLPRGHSPRHATKDRRLNVRLYSTVYHAPQAASKPHGPGGRAFQLSGTRYAITRRRRPYLKHHATQRFMCSTSIPARVVALCEY